MTVVLFSSREDLPKEVDIRVDEIIDPVHFAALESLVSDDTPLNVHMSDDNSLAMPDVSTQSEVE